MLTYLRLSGHSLQWCMDNYRTDNKLLPVGHQQEPTKAKCKQGPPEDKFKSEPVDGLEYLPKQASEETQALSIQQLRTQFFRGVQGVFGPIAHQNKSALRFRFDFPLERYSKDLFLGWANKDIRVFTDRCGFLIAGPKGNRYSVLFSRRKGRVTVDRLSAVSRAA